MFGGKKNILLYDFCIGLCFLFFIIIFFCIGLCQTRGFVVCDVYAAPFLR